MSYPPGSTVGNYRIEELLGSGGIGQVFRATHLDLDRAAAVKIMHMQYAGDPSFQARFKREARAAGTLHHPHIVEIIDSGQDNGRFYLVMELVPDGSLRLLLRERTALGEPLPLHYGIGLVLQAAQGLAYAHEHGMIHRDIKPDNLLVARTHNDAGDETTVTVKLSDFGLVRLGEEGLATAQGTTMGTPAYMSPEQCQGLELDARTDIYSLGVVLYEVTTGYLPFHTASLTDAVFKHVYTDPPPPRSVKADLPVALEGVILRCLRKAPAERYLNTQQLIDALEALLPALTPARPVMTAPTEDGALTIQQRVAPLTAALALSIANERYLAAPGGSAQIAVNIANRGTSPTSVELAVDGAPAGWLQLPTRPVEIAAGATATQIIGVNVPAQSAQAEHRLTIAARSTTNPSERQTAGTTLVVQPAAVGPFAATSASGDRSGISAGRLALPLLIVLAGVLMMVGARGPWIDWGDGSGVPGPEIINYLGETGFYADVSGDGRTTFICGIVVALAGLGRIVPVRRLAGWMRAMAALALLAGLAGAAYGWGLLQDYGYQVGWGVQLVAIAAGAGLVVVVIDSLRRSKS